jgi:hypothetical protein
MQFYSKYFGKEKAGLPSGPAFLYPEVTINDDVLLCQFQSFIDGGQNSPLFFIGFISVS